MADYSAYKPALNDTDYGNKVNDLIDAIESDVTTLENTYNAITHVSADYTVLAADKIIVIDCSSGDVVVTLPAGASSAGRQLTLYRVGAANTITIDADVTLLNFDSVEALSVDGASIAIVGDTTRWLRIIR